MSAADDDFGPVLRRLDLDVRGERQVALLRLVAAIVVALGALWIAAIGPGLAGWVIVLLAAIAAFFWAKASRASRRRVANPAGSYLAIAEMGLHIGKDGTVCRVPRAEVTGIELDEDRLVVVVRRRDGTSVIVEPIYGGIGAYDLHETLDRWHRQGDASGLPVRAAAEHD